MARRKELKSIANDLISSFISRNNDVNGYWGIGKLYSFMLEQEELKIEIDLIERSISPQNIEFAKIISIYSEWLQTQVENRGLKNEYLKSAKMELLGFSNDFTSHDAYFAPHRINCNMVIEDDRGQKYSISKSVRCRAHNSTKELKSTR